MVFAWKFILLVVFKPDTPPDHFPPHISFPSPHSFFTSTLSTVFRAVESAWLRSPRRTLGSLVDESSRCRPQVAYLFLPFSLLVVFVSLGQTASFLALAPRIYLPLLPFFRSQLTRLKRARFFFASPAILHARFSRRAQTHGFSNPFSA